jgi:hypothetical protein
MWKKVKIMVILVALLIIGGCISKENDPIKYIMSRNLEQKVTPIKELSTTMYPRGIFTIPDGSLFGVVNDGISLFDNKGSHIWTKRGIGSRYAIPLDNGEAVLAESYKKEEHWKSTLIMFDSEGNILWERQTGEIGEDGLAVTPNGSFIAVGATDKEYNGHLMLFDRDGNKLWDHQINGRSGKVTSSKIDRISGRIETVAVSKSGYVVAAPRDQYIYVYNCNGELIFKYFAHTYYDAQDIVIAPDESYFLFASERNYLNCYTLEGELIWQKEIGSLHIVKISQDSEYIAVGTINSSVILLDKHGNILWNNKITSDHYVIEVAISGHGEYVVVPARNRFFFPTYAFEVYNKEGHLLWRYEEEYHFKALAISDDGHYLAASNGFVLLFFDNLAAIEEYSNTCNKN